MTKDFIVQAKGWVVMYKTWHSRHLFIPHEVRDRGERVRELSTAARFDENMVVLLCGLTTDELAL